jgi:hypothetical protein
MTMKIRLTCSRLAPGMPRQPFEEDLSYDYVRNLLASVNLFVDIAVKRHGAEEIESLRRQADKDYSVQNQEVESRKRKADDDHSVARDVGEKS